jgi:hypothetical protein
MPVIHTINKGCWNCVHEEDAEYPCEQCDSQGLGKAPSGWEDGGVLFVMMEVELEVLG